MLTGLVNFAGRGARHDRQVVPVALCKDQTRLATLENQLNRSARKTNQDINKDVVSVRHAFTSNIFSSKELIVSWGLTSFLV